MFVHICKFLHINIFAFLCVGASIQSVCACVCVQWMSMCSGLIAQSTGGKTRSLLLALGAQGGWSCGSSSTLSSWT